MRSATAGFHSDLHMKNIMWKIFLYIGTTGQAGFSAAFTKNIYILTAINSTVSLEMQI